MSAKKRKPKRIVVWAVVMVNRRGAHAILQAYPYRHEAMAHRDGARWRSYVHVVRCEGTLR